MTRKTFTGDAMIDAFTPKLADMSEHSLMLGQGFAVEAGRFYAHRLRAYASFIDKLAGCKTLADISALQTQFVADAQRDYSNEGAALAAVATGTGMADFAQPRSAPAP